MEQIQPTPYDYNEMLDIVECLMREHGTVEIEPISVFTPGLYTRSIIVPPDTYLLSYTHNTDHQFIMSEGEIVIYTEDAGMVLMGGPYLGKTLKGTRRFAKTLSKVVWTSIHATDIQPKNGSKIAMRDAVKCVEAELFLKRENIFLIKAREELKWPA